MKTFTRYVTSALAVMICLMLLVSPTYGKVKGTCAHCHTMHNSQDGAHMMINETVDGTGGTGGSLLNDGSYPNLTRSSCIGCHTGENGTGGTTPFVYSTDAIYGTNTLAGGNFKWAVNNDEMGHNVSGIPGMSGDTALAAGAPGGTFGCANSCHQTLFNPKEGEATINGCEGCHLDAQHHATQQAPGDPALEVNGFFRFLSGHNGGYGVHGIEDSSWEYDPSALNHNEYLGKHAESTNNTMTRYCVGCHGNFHAQQVDDKWIRHPSDGVLPITGEYTAYTLYDPDTPVARPDLASISASDAVRPGTDMVMCLSCHRAHGSPYPDMLRWEYTSMSAGTGAAVGNDGTGCLKCHSAKN